MERIIQHIKDLVPIPDSDLSIILESLVEKRFSKKEIDSKYEEIVECVIVYLQSNPYTGWSKKVNHYKSL